MSLRTQVGIVGAGPAGLMLSHLLHLQGIDSVVVEARSRQYVEERVRAGVLEQGTADLMVETGVGERLKREGLIHHGIELRFAGRTIASISRNWRTAAASSSIRRIKWWRIFSTRAQAAGGRVIVEAEDVSVHDFDECERRREAEDSFPRGRRIAGTDCDFIAGCDGFHGVCRPSIPAGALTIYDRVYPFGWLGILAEAPPSSDELIYAYHERGFALLSMRYAGDQPALHPVRSPMKTSTMADDAHLAGTAECGWRRPTELEAHRGTDPAKGRHRDAQLRGRADAVSASSFWPAMRRTSCRRPARRA